MSLPLCDSSTPNLPRRDAEQRLPVVHQLPAAIPALNTRQRSGTETEPQCCVQGSGSFPASSQGCANPHSTLGAHLCSLMARLFMGEKLLRRLLGFVQLKWGRCFSPVNRIIPGCHIPLQRAFSPRFCIRENVKKLPNTAFCSVASKAICSSSLYFNRFGPGP